MENANPIIEIVKNVGPIIWRYIKYQTNPNSFVGECGEKQKSLESRRDDIEGDLESQLMSFGKIPKKEVADWLKKATKATESVDVDQFNIEGCFCNICRAKHFDKRAAELKRIYDEGANFTNAGPDLVQDDFSIIKEHSMKEFKDINQRLLDQKEGVKSALDDQECSTKTVKGGVKFWLGKVEKTIEAAQDEVNRGGCLSPPDLVKLVKEKNAALKKLLDEGNEYTFAGAILVQDDPLKMKEHLMSKFGETKESLRCRKEDVQSKLHDQQRFRKIVMDEVKLWLKKVDKQIETAEDEVRADGCLPPSRLAKLLEEKIRGLNKLLDEGKEYTNPGAILVKDDPSTIRGIPLQAEECYGRDTALEKILEYLKGDKVTRIAVWGMGGMGKTTLMKQVHNQLLNESKFDKVIWVTVSQNLNVLKIQDEIVKQLKEDALTEDDATRRAGIMSAMLRRGSYLLILDDMWDAFCVEEVGFPTNFGDNHSKLVLTTRNKDVARKIDCNAIIELKPLSSEQALQLFLEKVGRAVLSDDENIKPRLKSTIMQIVEECDGLPLAIVTVASTMKGKSKPYAWVKALKQLQEASEIVFAGEKGPMGKLKFSYDRLESKKLQDCFLYCALYPEDDVIPKRELIEKWIGEGFFDDQMGTWDDMICEGLDILGKLQDNCLLERIQSAGEVDYSGKKFSEVDFGNVKMHDLLRDMALGISSQSHRCFVEVRLSVEELRVKEAWAAKVEKVSFVGCYMGCYMKELLLNMSDLKYDRLTT